MHKKGNYLDHQQILFSWNVIFNLPVVGAKTIILKIEFLCEETT
jgi:hypothetical protein